MPCKANVDMVLTPDITKDPVKWTMENCITKLKGGYGSYPVLSVGKDQAPTDHLGLRSRRPTVPRTCGICTAASRRALGACHTVGYNQT